VKRLIAVVVNYETAHATEACIRSLAASTRAPDAVVVVDNGSRDQSPDALGALRGITLLPLPRNLGFAGGCNHGVRHALARGANQVLLINSDARVAPDALERLSLALDGNPAWGIAGPTVVSNGNRIESRGIRYSARTGRMLCLEHDRVLETRVPDQQREVDAVSGCAMLISRDVLERDGLLDEDFFYSFEDLDLCLRAARAGRRSVCVTAALVHHAGGVTIGPGSPRRIYFATRNHLRLSGAQGATPMRLLRQGLVLGFNVLHVLVRRPTPRVSGLLAVGRGALDHLLGRYGRGTIPTSDR
jgi:hypothetical protein